mmetsp:Transcript_18816/g.56828  ORF Transcript_18816/g.56828 Transcript_18816/m.56828 type:complete len:214 (-) Transcript_18816:648-1289(-)
MAASMDGLRHPRYHGVGASCLLDTQHAMGGHGASVRHGRNWSNNLWALLLATRHVGMVAGGWRAHRCILSLGIPLPRRFRAAQRLLLRAANVTHPARCPCMGVISVGAACRLPLPHRVRDPHVLFPCSWPFPSRCGLLHDLRAGHALAPSPLWCVPRASLVLPSYHPHLRRAACNLHVLAFAALGQGTPREVGRKSLRRRRTSRAGQNGRAGD